MRGDTLYADLKAAMRGILEEQRLSVGSASDYVAELFADAAWDVIVELKGKNGSLADESWDGYFRRLKEMQDGK